MSDPNSFSSDGISGVERFLISHERHGVATPGTLEEAVLDLCLRARRDENRNLRSRLGNIIALALEIPGVTVEGVLDALAHAGLVVVDAEKCVEMSVLAFDADGFPSGSWSDFVAAHRRDLAALADGRYPGEHRLFPSPSEGDLRVLVFPSQATATGVAP